METNRANRDGNIDPRSADVPIRAKDKIAEYVLNPRIARLTASDWQAIAQASRGGKFF